MEVPLPQVQQGPRKGQWDRSSLTTVAAQGRKGEGGKKQIVCMRGVWASEQGPPLWERQLQAPDHKFLMISIAMWKVFAGKVMTSYISNWFTLLLLCTSIPLVLCNDWFDRGSRQGIDKWPVDCATLV